MQNYFIVDYNFFLILNYDFGLDLIHILLTPHRSNAIAEKYTSNTFILTDSVQYNIIGIKRLNTKRNSIVNSQRESL